MNTETSPKACMEKADELSSSVPGPNPFVMEPEPDLESDPVPFMEEPEPDVETDAEFEPDLDADSAESPGEAVLKPDHQFLEGAFVAEPEPDLESEEPGHQFPELVEPLDDPQLPDHHNPEPESEPVHDQPEIQDPSPFFLGSTCFLSSCLW